MSGKFTEMTPPQDVELAEIPNPVKNENVSEIPSLSELKEKMEEIFPKMPSERMEGAEMPQAKPTETPENRERMNDTNEVNDITAKTDDNGDVYMVDGKLMPNSQYELNGDVYTTDDNGRIIQCEARPQRSPENPRDNEAQREAGGEDRKENDQGGHIVGRDLNGDGGGGNLVAMDSKINQSDYKRMENDIKNDLDDGKEVTTKTEISYEGDSKRPDKITVTVTADGKDTVYKFDNNLDNSLKDEVPENGKQTVQSELHDTGGAVSSIKENYDEKGNIEKTTVSITYTNEQGKARRTKVVIENAGGDN